MVLTRWHLWAFLTGRLILCQVGGGQDGASLAEAFVQARFPEGTVGLLLTGPYLPADVRAHIRRVAAEQPRLRILEFVTEPSRLLRCADRVIAMGGYNAVCEVLSFGKTALIVPRIHPRASNGSERNGCAIKVSWTCSIPTN